MRADRVQVKGHRSHDRSYKADGNRKWTCKTLIVCCLWETSSDLKGSGGNSAQEEDPRPGRGGGRGGFGQNGLYETRIN